MSEIICENLCNELSNLMGEQITFDSYETIYGVNYVIDINADVIIYYKSKNGYHFDILDKQVFIKFNRVQDVINYIDNYVI